MPESVGLSFWQDWITTVFSGSTASTT
jgi:hypothetical protein